MAFKLKPPYKVNNIPVHEVPFSMDNDKGASDGLVAKANDNFSIIVMCISYFKNTMYVNTFYMKR